MENHSISYFRNLLSNNVQHLEHSCEEWEKICCENDLPEDVLGEIRTTIGLAKLLMKQKLRQFGGLIDDSEFQRGEMKITYLDLQGFWDMVYFEVEKLFKRFKVLDQCKNNKWEFVEEITNGTEQKKKQFNPEQRKQAVSLQSHSVAARQRIAEAKKKMLSQFRKQKENEFVIEIVQPSKEKLNSEEEKHTKELIESSTESEMHNSGLIINKNVMKNENTREKQPLAPKRNENKPAVEIAELLKEGPKETCKSIRDQEMNNEIKTKENKENFPSAKENHRKPKLNGKLEEKISSKAIYQKRSKLGNQIKLQCVTRSAKKALQVQQNVLQ